MPKDLTDRQLEIREAYYDNNCSETKTLEQLGISVQALRKHLYLCAKKGYRIDPDAFCEHAPAGWGMFMSTIQSNNEGVVQRWDRVKPFENNLASLLEYLKTRVPVNPISITAPKNCDPNIQLEWTLADVHYGMLAWDKETGADYDIEIAQDLIRGSAEEVFGRTGKIKSLMLILMGDNFHTDFFESRTEKSGNILDVDSRYPKIIRTGVELYINVIEYGLQFAEYEKVTILYGNHDKQTSSVLPLILHYYFKNEPRVDIDLSPAKQHYNYWGCVATTYHHGDGTNKNRLCGDFTRHVAMQGIPGIKYFYVKVGHTHGELVEDINGVTYEIVPSPVAKDAYAKGANFSAKRASVATLYHKEYGEIGRYSITPQALEMKRGE